MSQTPPSRDEFNAQATELINELGTTAFCAPPGKMPDYTLFVDDNRVIAEPRGEPRHPYGIHCEVPEGMTQPQMDEALQKWLESGEAYEAFISTNVCRFNC
ncbi:hypothetical protein A3194_10920 [Candidatus Thiodiazotropha endoloripes]|uniref:hypothetical protein n=1 Tax=Candidatus Thiodiazotropha endoloripes TaxID=1818881 RepID=UPI00083CC075|nr:hypothetical protein [Candidatus Thiodiazotropha endoloripes]ODB89656.1 hypothetical protein A3194_10920 [Candidatus Thiodiazotropha endoloripes]